MKNDNKVSMCVAVLLALTVNPGFAELTEEQAARLGKDLTPVGAEKAGNAAGTIPAWTGGLKSPADAGAKDFKSGGHHPDPYASDKPLFSITSGNMGQYADNLTEGHKEMLKLYDSFRMDIYPAHRSAALPDRIYKATAKVARTAKLAADGNGVTGATVGVPFPIPENGNEVIWNHILRYRGDGSIRNIGQAPMTRSGDYTMVKLVDKTYFVYHDENTDPATNNMVGMFLQDVQAPPRLAGRVLLVHETLNQNAELRKAWIYNPGQRRVRRAPNIAFDTPGTASDGLRTSDQFDMFNGSPERYNWNLVGKKEIYVPYNSYKLHSNQLKYDDILKPLHMNPDHLRFELHRVWVVDAVLKPDTGHLYKRRTLYIDEDSWQILHVDQYDNRDQLWRVSDAHVINYYDVPAVWTTVEAHYDLQSGRYLAMGLNNEEDFTADFSVDSNPSDFTVSSLRRSGRR